MKNVHELRSEDALCNYCEGVGRRIGLKDNEVASIQCAQCGGVQRKPRIPDHILFSNSYAIDAVVPTAQQDRNRRGNR